MVFTKDDIVKLDDMSGSFEKSAEWFSSKWNIPVEEYLKSMEKSLTAKNGVPKWYIIANNENKIIAGVGVIENDFHKRPDLTPNICALFVEKEYRRRGIARMLLEFACEELSRCGIMTVYLITSHTEFYERCGWAFYDMIEENDGNMIRMYKHQTRG